MTNFYEEIQDEQQEAPLIQLEPRNLLFRALRNWYLFPLFLALGLTAAFLYLRYTTPTYLLESEILNRATAEEQISSSLFGEYAGAAMMSQNQVADEIQILRSRNLLEEVVQALELEVFYFSKGRIQDLPLYPAKTKSPILVEPIWPFEETARNTLFELELLGNGQYRLSAGDWTLTEAFGKLISTPWGEMVIRTNLLAKEKLPVVQFNINNPATRADAYGKKLNVLKAGRETNAISLSLLENLPERGIDFLQTVFGFYEQSIIDQKKQLAEKTIEFIDQRLEYLGEELEISARESENYLLENNLIEGIEAKLEIQMTALREYDQQLAMLQLQEERWTPFSNCSMTIRPWISSPFLSTAPMMSISMAQTTPA